MTRMDLGESALGRAGAAVLTRMGRRLGPRGIAAVGLRLGPYRKLSLAAVEGAPHGVDLGPLEPRLPDALYTADRRIQLAPREYLDDLARLRDRAIEPSPELQLIGRRQLRSNNSWLHNSQRLVKGKPRCTLLVHPADASRLGLRDGGQARVQSRVGQAVVPVEVSDDIMPGVVSLPHGWGHDRPGIGLAVAAAHAGASINDLTDEQRVDRLSGTSSFSGVPVAVEAVEAAEALPPEAADTAADTAAGAAAGAA
jgi:anaerobic selenocysteine-containing dehydrogenase